MKKMKKNIKILVLFLFFTTHSEGQILGVGYQNASNSNQFVASVNLPYTLKGSGDTSLKSGKIFMLFGADYTSVNNSGFSGWYIKPVQLHYNFKSYNNKNTYYDVALEGSYLINNGLGTNGIIVSPSIYVDSHFLFLKTGYEYHLQDKNSQVFVRIGFAIGYNLLGNLKPMKMF